jgi:hypothetical protein
MEGFMLLEMPFVGRPCSRPILRRRCPRMPPLFARCGPCSTVGWAALGTHSQVVPGRTSREINDSRADSMMIELLANSACQKQSKTMVGVLFAFFSPWNDGESVIGSPWSLTHMLAGLYTAGSQSNRRSHRGVEVPTSRQWFGHASHSFYWSAPRASVAQFR